MTGFLRTVCVNGTTRIASWPATSAAMLRLRSERRIPSLLLRNVALQITNQFAKVRNVALPQGEASVVIMKLNRYVYDFVKSGFACLLSVPPFTTVVTSLVAVLFIAPLTFLSSFLHPPGSLANQSCLFALTLLPCLL